MDVFEVKAARVRFLAKLNIVAGCWVWSGARRGAYGIARLGHRMRNAHRVAYALFVGDVDDGISVVHTCGNKLCCNPGHLRLEMQEKMLTQGASADAAA